MSEHIKDFPIFQPVASRDDIKVAEWYIEALMKVAVDAANEARAVANKLNECLPVKKVNLLALDDVRGCFDDIIQQIQARPDMILESREYDR